MERRREAPADRTRIRIARRRARRARRRLSARGTTLPGIHDPVRVEELLDAAIERDEVAVLALEIAELAVADAVLAGARAAARKRIVDEAPRSAPRPARSRPHRRDRAGTRRGSCRRRRGRRFRRATRSRRARSRACSIASASSDTGTATSVVIAFEPGASASDAISALCRALHIWLRAVGSLSDSNAVAPSSPASSRVVARSPATPASVPPNSTKRYGDSGKLVPANAFSAAIVVASSSSQRVTGTPEPMIAAAARHADSIDGKAARATTMCSGIGCSRSVSSVMTPSVPSEPTKRPVRL